MCFGAMIECDQAFSVISTRIQAQLWWHHQEVKLLANKLMKQENHKQAIVLAIQ